MCSVVPAVTKTLLENFIYLKLQTFQFRTLSNHLMVRVQNMQHVNVQGIWT